jgi:hypothetical protein
MAPGLLEQELALLRERGPEAAHKRALLLRGPVHKPEPVWMIRLELQLLRRKFCLQE